MSDAAGFYENTKRVKITNTDMFIPFTHHGKVDVSSNDSIVTSTLHMHRDFTSGVYGNYHIALTGYHALSSLYRVIDAPVRYYDVKKDDYIEPYVHYYCKRYNVCILVEACDSTQTRRVIKVYTLVSDDMYRNVVEFITKYLHKVN